MLSSQPVAEHGSSFSSPLLQGWKWCLVLFQHGEASCAAETIKCTGAKAVNAHPHASGLCHALSDSPSCQPPAGSSSSLLPWSCAQKLSEESTEGNKAEESSHFPRELRSRCYDPLVKCVSVTFVAPVRDFTVLSMTPTKLQSRISAGASYSCCLSHSVW